MYPSFILGARLMGQEDAWNHPPLFAYTDRWVEKSAGDKSWAGFSKDMWTAYNPKAKPAAGR